MCKDTLRIVAVKVDNETSVKDTKNFKLTPSNVEEVSADLVNEIKNIIVKDESKNVVNSKNDSKDVHKNIKLGRMNLFQKSYFNDSNFLLSIANLSTKFQKEGILPRQSKNFFRSCSHSNLSKDLPGNVLSLIHI